MVPDDAEQPRAKQLAAPSDAFFLQIENVPQNRLPAPYLELPHVRRKVLVPVLLHPSGLCKTGMNPSSTC